MSAPIVFIAAEPRECLPWISRWKNVEDAKLPVHWSRSGEYHGVQMIAIANGAGAVRAEAAASASPKPRAFFSIGYCGALDPALKIGDIFIATDVVTAGVRNPVKPFPAPRANAGAICSAPSIAWTATQKRELRAGGAEAVEMEAAGVLATANHLGVPFYCIRVVSDLAEEDFAINFNLFLMPNGRFNVVRLIAHSCVHPLKRFRELIRLSRRTTLASKNLGEFLARCSF